MERGEKTIFPSDSSCGLGVGNNIPPGPLSQYDVKQLNLKRVTLQI